MKDYARRLIAGHKKADAQLRRLARAKGVTLPTEPSLAQKAKLQLLQTADGAEFDRRDVENVGVEAHRDTIERFRKEASEGRDPQVKAFAQQTLPKLEQHLQMAQNLQGGLDGRGAATGDRRSDRGDRTTAGAATTAGATAAGATMAGASVAPAHASAMSTSPGRRRRTSRSAKRCRRCRWCRR